ncbi:hypothetical protein P171DRAFT_426302 [Karstenula rhodostoma CBS 690.94]|uniref:Uncharacterized protein n=1 Tax=Karstenula rhodostoma CBS 690.94 TaxID=1392251 RepID=A0A9P4PX66_9PLEO|nr:hypothetical protein P171DRAFT_426302 [Karstenula rhodostoma CBS 690.94]
MEEYESRASSGGLPVKPLLYTCYLLGVAAVCTNQPTTLYRIYMWFIELEKTSGAFPFALTVPQKQKGWGVVLCLQPDRDGTIHELEVGRDMSALCRQRWRYDSWARL